MGHERSEKHLGLSATSYQRLESLPMSLVTSSANGVGCLVSDQVANYRARITGVVTRASDSLEVHWWSKVAERWGIRSKASNETSRMGFYMFLVPINDRPGNQSLLPAVDKCRL